MMTEKMVSTEEQWTEIIRPYRGWFDLHLAELWRYRDLIKVFVHRDFVTNYKQTILGPFWFIIQPLVNTIVFTIVFGKVAKLSTDGLPQLLFYMSGTELWGFFSSCLNKTSGTLRGNAGLFGKVYFPRLTVPIAGILNNLIAFVLQFVIFLGFYGYFYLQDAPVKPNILILYTPLLLLQLAMLGMGIGLINSALTTKYRDLSFVIGFIERLGMYATPVVYPLSIVPAKWKWVFTINPLAAPLEIFRYAFLGKGTVELIPFAFSWGITISIFLVGLFIFHYVERNFIDLV